MSYAWFAGGALWIVWILSLVLGPGRMDLFGQAIGTDYIQFYAAGRTLLNGEGDQLYDFSYQLQLEQDIAGPDFDSFHAFITPPFLALLYSPLSALSYEWSFVVWSSLGIACLYFSLRLLDPGGRKSQVIWALSWFPVFAAVSFGQNSLLSLAILSVTYALWKRERHLLSGIVCSLLFYKPQLILGVGFLWLLDWRQSYKSLIGLILGGLGLTTMSIMLLPAASKEYAKFAFETLPTLSSFQGFPIWHSQTLRDAWLLLLPGTRPIANVFHILISLVGLVLFYRLRKFHADQNPLLFAMAICLTVLITPHAMIYDWAILIIPSLLLWEYRPTDRDQLRVLYALIWVVTFVTTQLTRGQLSLFSRALQVSVPVYVFALINLGQILRSSGSVEGPTEFDHDPESDDALSIRDQSP
jgi:alpha-1,2-mannosyltransferase